jgi:hypothetical protein
MALFWRRKAKDRFVTLGLNEPREGAPTRDTATPESRSEFDSEPHSGSEYATPKTPASRAVELPRLEPVVTGAAPTPLPAEFQATERLPVATAQARPAPPSAHEDQSHIHISEPTRTT